MALWCQSHRTFHRWGELVAVNYLKKRNRKCDQMGGDKDEEEFGS